MRTSREIEFNNCRCNGSFEEPTICPVCDHALKPQELALHAFQNEHNEWFLSGFYLCRACFQTFVTLHRCHVEDICHKYRSSLIYAEPQRFHAQPFDKNICALSPQFVKIYNQALAADEFGLDEIAGLGYRKSIEYLLKDYLCRQDPSNSDAIKSEFLGKAIGRIKEVRIKTLTERAVWIGNDEAHYVRKHQKLDIDDMKRFIDALLHYVASELTFEEALAIKSER